MKQHLKNYSLLYVSLLVGVIYLIPSFAHAFSDPVQVQIGATNHPIRNVWTALLDFSNVVALIFFLGIAFANLLRIQINVYGIKKILPALIVGIILANFSLLICQLLLDLAGAATGLFEQGRGFLSYWLSSTDTFQTAAAATSASSSGATPTEEIRAVISALLKLAAAVMTMILGIMFLLRNYIIMFLVVFSPIAFLSMAVPASKAIWTRWWKAFSQWTFMLPVSMFWLWVGTQFFQFTDQFNSTEVAFFTGISFAGYAFGMICVYLAMTTPFRMAGELQNIAKKVQSTALTGLGVYAGTRAAQQWGQNRLDSTKAHLISYTGIGNLVRGAQLDKAATKTKMDLALAGPVHRDVGKFKLPKILGGKEMAVSDTWKWFRPLSAFGLGSKGADRLTSEAEVRKKDLESRQKEARIQDAGINGRYGRARRRRATTAEQSAERAKKAETDERAKLMFGEDYKEFKNMDDEMSSEDYVRFHNERLNAGVPNAANVDKLFDAIEQGLIEKYTREFKAEGSTNPQKDAQDKVKAELIKQLNDPAEKEKMVDSYNKRYDTVLESSQKINRSLNGKDAPLATAGEMQGLVKQYKGTNEDTRAAGYRQAVNQQKIHELVVKNREDETMVTDTMGELHKMLQGQELNQLLDELDKAKNNINEIIKNDMTNVKAGSEERANKLFHLVRQMRKKGEDLSDESKVRSRAKSYRDRVKENPDLISVMQLRMHHNVVGSWIGEKAKGDAESESAVETFENLFKNFSLDELGHLMAGDLSTVSPDKVLWFQRGTQTAAKSMAAAKDSPEYGQFLTGLANYLEKARNAKGVNGRSLEDRISDFLTTVSPPAGPLATALASAPNKYNGLIEQIKKAASSPFKGARSPIATYLSQIGINDNLAVGRTPILNRNNLIYSPNATTGVLEPEKNLLKTNF